MIKKSVFQFKITLQEIEPMIWRRIQISEQCNFWELHVAIQDAMGWTDTHLHHFEVVDPETYKKQCMGIPAEDEFDFDIHNTLPGWNYLVKDYILANIKMTYLYDYGDSWHHLIEFEGLKQKKDQIKYPICIEGKRACPPEDVGGIPGYYNCLNILNDKKHKEHQSMKMWVGEKYNSEKFDPKKVKFDNPNVRWKRAFNGD